MVVPGWEADENSHTRMIARRVIFRRNSLEVPLTKSAKMAKGHKALARFDSQLEPLTASNKSY